MSNSRAAQEAAQLIERLERLARLGESTVRLNPAQWDALRYFARANRFSRTPAALAAYLASTRGTVSRTLVSLETKGYLMRGQSERDGRSVEFGLTRKGETALRSDPIVDLASDIEAALGAESGDLVVRLQRTLANAIARNQGRPFGACFSCRHFRPNSSREVGMPHHCALLNEPLSAADSRAICVEQEPIAA
jgi:DNA-binding MarR family transcriptional regulator